MRTQASRLSKLEATKNDQIDQCATELITNNPTKLFSAASSALRCGCH